MTTYVLFGFDTHYPEGGSRDIIATWDSTMVDEGNRVLAEHHIAQEQYRLGNHELVAIDGEHVRRVGEWIDGEWVPSSRTEKP